MNTAKNIFDHILKGGSDDSEEIKEILKSIDPEYVWATSKASNKNGQNRDSTILMLSKWLNRFNEWARKEGKKLAYLGITDFFNWLRGIFSGDIELEPETKTVKEPETKKVGRKKKAKSETTETDTTE